MTTEAIAFPATAVPSRNQRLFLRYFTAVLVDMVVLGLFAQFWDRVFVSSFAITLAAALVLQVLLKLTLALEHRVSAFWKEKEGSGARAGRLFSAWLILFGSKFAILYALDVAFSHDVHFEGALHGVVPLILVLVVMLAAEEGLVRFYRSLA
jgi:hypothetical protein